MQIRVHNPSLSFDYRTGEKVLSFVVDKESTADAEHIVDGLQGIPLQLEVKRFREKRSLSANAYAWVLIDKIAEVTKLIKSDIYRHAIREIGGVSDPILIANEAIPSLSERWAKNGTGWFVDVLGESHVPGMMDCQMFYGSSTYDTAQMSRLIDSLVVEAKSVHIETLPPAELERMTKSWEERERRL